VRAYKNPVIRVLKMLASTVQFSTYDQTPPPRPRRTRNTPRGARRYEKQDGPDTRSRIARSLRTQQRAYDPVLRAIRFHTPPRPEGHRDAVLGTDRSRRPNWSAFHPRAPPHTLAGTRSWAPITV
jgi:hypothetical protein